MTLGPLTLIIGNKTYSSWSLRAWLGLVLSGLPFEEHLIPLDTPDFQAGIGDLSPSRTVPALHTPDGVVWDSLAVLEWAAERVPSLWPLDAVDRARARSVSAEMHSGFAALRAELPMNLRRTPAPVSVSQACRSDIDRVAAIWSACLEVSGGPWLFGAAPGIADAMFAPVATRFRAYAVDMPDPPAGYVDTVYALPAFQAWEHAAQAEPWVIETEER